jgi:hypothetical protein
VTAVTDLLGTFASPYERRGTIAGRNGLHRGSGGPRHHTRDAVRPRRSFLLGGAAALAVGLGAGVRALVDDAGADAAGGTGAAGGPQLARQASPASALQIDRARNRVWDWSRFTELPVSEPWNTMSLTTIGPIAHATGVGGPSAGDRRLYALRDVQATDVEVAALFLPSEYAQFGIGMRIQPDRAVVVWQNVLFRGNARVIEGVWEFDGSSLHSTNQQDVFSPGVEWEAVGAVGDGSTVTVTTARPHQIGPGTFVFHGGDMVDLGMGWVTATPGPYTYVFPSPLVGSWGPGTWQTMIVAEPRWLAARLVGNRVTFKQWLPREIEPSWDDPARAIVSDLPVELDSGGAPPQTGGVGMMIGHLGDGGRVEVRDLRVTPLA